MEIELANFLHREESENLEYKEGFDKDDFAETLASFSTHTGGIILIGVKDNGEPMGFTKPGKFDELLQMIAKDVNGRANISINTFPHTKDLVIIAVNVKEGDNKPYGWKSAYYDRRGKNDNKLDPNEIFQIKLKSLNLTFDSLKAHIYGREATISDIDEGILRRFIEAIKTSKRQKIIDFQNVKQTLKNLDLLSENEHQPKNAALLFFAKDPQKAFPSARINFLVYKGDEINEDYKLRRYVDGTIIDQLFTTYNLFQQYIESKIIIHELKRIELTQYPMLAIREALINALAHRDYSITDSEIVIRVFKNRIEILNPGGLLKGINLEELRKGGHFSKRRNPIICKLFDDMGFMEQSGQGIKNIINEMKRMGLKEPIITADENSFKITFEGHSLEKEDISSPNAKVADLEKILNKRQKKAIEYIQTELKDKEGITATEYKDKYKVHIITAMSDLSLLQNIGLLKNEKIGRSRKYFKVI
jgi:ATP-dependent DNA helicase RecG